MAYYYVDIATGSAGNGGTSWADAKATLGDGLTLATAAGDIVYYRANSGETTKDTFATTQTLTVNAAGTPQTPIRIIGVKAGTTNEGASVVESDLADRSGDQPVFEVTGAGNDLNIDNSSDWYGVRFVVADLIDIGEADGRMTFTECEFDMGGYHQISTGDVSVHFIRCLITTSNAIALNSTGRPRVEYRGCDFSGSFVNLYPTITNLCTYHFYGCDFSGATSMVRIANVTGFAALAKFINCRIPTGLVLNSNTMATENGYIEMIGCSDGTSKTNSASYQEYEYEDFHGNISVETTAVRTDGADDGASGGFSYALTPHANGVTEGSGSALASPWLSRWVNGGTSITATVYIANSTASTDYTEDEVWCEFYHPDASDTAQSTLVITDNTADDYSHIINGNTAVTDDTGSTWGTGANNHQKFSITFTPGYQGWVYARVYVAKRQASPDTVYVDPKIEIV